MHDFSAGIDLDVNPIAVPSYVRSYCLQRSSDKGTCSTGVTGCIEDLNRGVRISKVGNPFRAEAHTAFIADMNE